MGILDKIKKAPAAKKSEAKKETKSEAVEPKKEAVKKSAPTAAAPARDTKEAYRVLVRPLVTEKSTDLSARGKYVFAVAPQTNKVEVKKAVESLYGVKVKNVNILNQHGKVVFFGGRVGKRSNVKKAIVTLAKGEKITVFEGV